MDISYDCELQWCHSFSNSCASWENFSNGLFLIGINVNCKVLRKVIVPHFDVWG